MGLCPEVGKVPIVAVGVVAVSTHGVKRVHFTSKTNCQGNGICAVEEVRQSTVVEESETTWYVAIEER